MSQGLKPLPLPADLKAAGPPAAVEAAERGIRDISLSSAVRAPLPVPNPFSARCLTSLETLSSGFRVQG
eukprot:225697-Chlamydomonas_euryale.AAC.2